MVTDPIRRRALAILADRESTTRTALAERLAADEAVPTDDVRRLEILLHHQHLPKLEDERYVEYDRRNGEISLWADPSAVRFRPEES